MMPLRFLYNILVALTWQVLKLVALFQPKMKLFVSGRKKTFGQLESKLNGKSKTIWMHVASLGEFEQGLPILERLRHQYPDHILVVSFFSPSGFEVKKNTTAADVVVYLPMDTKANAKRFLNLVNPDLALFVKYEIWPNYLQQLKQNNVPTLLFSAIFSERQVFFKSYGGFMRQSLNAFSHFFVQDETSKKLLANIGLENTTVVGDTRLDRVSEILNRDNELNFMEAFKGEKSCFVAGSTWPEDEEILIEFINSTQTDMKFVIAPHEIKPAHIEKITSALQKKTVLYSALEHKTLDGFDVLVIDTIGLLTKIYSYADLAYVGGGFATGLHNTMEPAVFGIPIIIGPQYSKFKEAADLVSLGGIIPISDYQSFQTLMDNFKTYSRFTKKVGAINSAYINSNKGASDLIMQHISDIL